MHDRAMCAVHLSAVRCSRESCFSARFTDLRHKLSSLSLLSSFVLGGQKLVAIGLKATSDCEDLSNHGAPVRLQMISSF